MSDDCIFCQIIEGEIPSHTVYEDDETYAFLDVNPLTRGHTLVIPKAHHERLNDMSSEEAASVFGVVNDLVPAVEEGVAAPASTVAVNNGEQAGQEVPHVHWHIVPRFPEDGSHAIHVMFDGVDLEQAEMETIAEDITAGL